MESPEYLLRSLGSLPRDRKKQFVRDALSTLGRFQGAHAVQRPRPPKDDRVALARVGSQAARLIQAIKRVGESETASMLLKDAWLNLEQASGEAVANPVPVLERLQKAAELCLPKPKSARNPSEQSAKSSMAIAALAHQFHEHFGRLPGFGPGAPFVRFVREALPAYGLAVPPLVEMKKIAAAG